MSSSDAEMPDGWRWYTDVPTGNPYLVHPHDVELTLERLRALLATQGLRVVSEDEWQVLRASKEVLADIIDQWQPREDEPSHD